MTDKTLTLATELAGASVANNDEVWIWDVSAGQLKKTTRAELIGGAYVLTVPATGTAALLAIANQFTATQTVAPGSSGTKGIVVDQPTGTTYLYPALEVLFNGVSRMSLAVASNANLLSLAPFDNGNSNGPYLSIGHNNNASTPAAGFLNLFDKTGSNRYLWADASGNARIHTSAPTGATDTSGTVIGTQTSNLDAKVVVGEPIGIDDVLAAIQTGALAVRRFVYKNGEFNGEEFSGLVTDFAPRYGMDRDDAHPAGKSLNIVTALGDLLMAVANLTERVRALEGAS